MSKSLPKEWLGPRSPPPHQQDMGALLPREGNQRRPRLGVSGTADAGGEAL